MSINSIKSEDFKPSDDQKFTSKERDILERNKNFFSMDKKYIDTMLKIINGESDISIRVLDWFVANYAKKNNTCYKIKINNKPDYFYVNTEYKNQLNGYSKQYFDPFCRKKKVIYTYRNAETSNDNGKIYMIFESSIGQLNFFHWAIRHQVIRYVQLHLKEIENDMKETTKLNKEKKISAVETNCPKISPKNQSSSNIDNVICSSDKINSFNISSSSKKISNSSTSDTKRRRQQLSKSVYEHGIKKSNITIRLDFDN